MCALTVEVVLCRAAAHSCRYQRQMAANTCCTLPAKYHMPLSLLTSLLNFPHSDACSSLTPWSPLFHWQSQSRAYAFATTLFLFGHMIANTHTALPGSWTRKHGLTAHNWPIRKPCHPSSTSLFHDFEATMCCSLHCEWSTRVSDDLT